jgi:hypothetical protein
MPENGLEVGGPSEGVYATDFTVPESSLLIEIRMTGQVALKH